MKSLSQGSWGCGEEGVGGGSRTGAGKRVYRIVELGSSGDESDKLRDHRKANNPQLCRAVLCSLQEPIGNNYEGFFLVFNETSFSPKFVAKFDAQKTIIMTCQ